MSILLSMGLVRELWGVVSTTSHDGGIREIERADLQVTQSLMGRSSLDVIFG
jgi:hypothetical protein